MAAEKANGKVQSTQHNKINKKMKYFLDGPGPDLTGHGLDNRPDF